MTNFSRLAFRVLERILLALGAALAAWCLFLVLRAEYYARMPIPPPPPAAISELPGENPLPPSAAGGAVPVGGWVARLESQALGLSATVLEGSDDDTLSRAAGHISETALPGEPGNIGIAGHRDTTFRPIRRIHMGDLLKLTTARRIFTYKVVKTSIVTPEDVEVLSPTEHPALTLVTCYPFEFIGHAPQRFIVRADLVGEESR